jgi:hypothetical protein
VVGAYAAWILSGIWARMGTDFAGSFAGSFTGSFAGSLQGSVEQTATYGEEVETELFEWTPETTLKA